jgi:hypothetical protein
VASLLIVSSERLGDPAFAAYETDRLARGGVSALHLISSLDATPMVPLPLLGYAYVRFAFRFAGRRSQPFSAACSHAKPPPPTLSLPAHANPPPPPPPGCWPTDQTHMPTMMVVYPPECMACAYTLFRNWPWAKAEDRCHDRCDAAATAGFQRSHFAEFSAADAEFWTDSLGGALSKWFALSTDRQGFFDRHQSNAFAELVCAAPRGQTVLPWTKCACYDAQHRCVKKCH